MQRRAERFDPAVRTAESVAARAHDPSQAQGRNLYAWAMVS